MGNKYEKVQEILDNYKSELSGADEDWTPKVQRAISYIHKHLFDSRLTVGWMMKQCRINGHNFSSRFKYYLGRTPKRYILHHRIEAAKQLMANPKLQDVSVSAVAFELGFSSAAVFSNAFKKLAGKSPSIWRKNNG